MSQARTLRRQQERAVRRAEAPAAVSAVPSAAPSAESSAAKLAANRANAQASTGPRTPEGKERSSQNAVKHGLFSKELAHPAAPLGEEREKLDELLTRLRESYRPCDVDEALLVDRLATLWWRLQRLNRQMQLRLRARLDQGAYPHAALTESEAIGIHEARVDRMLSRTRRDLEFLQRMRLGSAAHAMRRAAQANAEVEAKWRQEELAVNARIAAAQAETEAIRQRMASGQDGEPSHAAAQPPHPVTPGGVPPLPACV